MAADPEFVAHCLELLASLGPCRARRMFGGHGIYLDDLMFALIAGEELYLKTDPHTQAQWEGAGSHPFVYSSSERTVQMSYWSAPEEAMESPAAMRPWARLALDAALRSRKAAPAARARRKKTAARGSGSS
ncbi:MAG: TfoX family protein [Aquabacterium sp.]|jgi:DNA transformation protein|nr:MAG: TfoX family protein [Aquabacterium sp.]